MQDLMNVSNEGLHNQKRESKSQTKGAFLNNRSISSSNSRVSYFKAIR